LYDAFRKEARSYHGKDDLGIGWKCLCGGSAGGLGQLIATPFDLVKVRLIADRNRSKYSGFVDCVRKIYLSEGAKGFYRGWMPSVQRALMVNIGELSTYDESKQLILRNSTLQDGIVVHTMSSFMSGLVSSAISTPIDVVKSRMMANPDAYKGSLDCVAQTLKREGASAFSKGFLLVRNTRAPTRRPSTRVADPSAHMHLSPQQQKRNSPSPPLLLRHAPSQSPPPIAACAQSERC
jgi:tetrahydromethanopterin S-methyltransferase subunit F